jgi:hypothetical protein
MYLFATFTMGAVFAEAYAHKTPRETVARKSRKARQPQKAGVKNWKEKVLDCQSTSTW